MKLWQRFKLIREREGIPPLAKLLWTTLAGHVKDDDWHCFLSQDTLRRETGIKSLATIRKATEQLERLGLVSVSRPARYPGKGHACTYRLHLGGSQIRQDVTYSESGKYVTKPGVIRQSDRPNTSNAVHQPLNHMNRTASAPAREARAQRRTRTPEPGESPEAKRRRQLLGVADILGIQREHDEHEAEFLRRVESRKTVWDRQRELQ